MGIETTRSRKIEPHEPGPPATQPAVTLVPGTRGAPPFPSAHAGEDRVEMAGGTPALPDAQMSGAEMVIRALADQGAEHIFGYPGGAVLPIYDALFHQEKVRHILVRHEQGAVHAAEGYARSTGKVGFQECDTVGITRPCTKHNYLVKNVNDLARVLHEAFYVAKTGRPGPVVVDIPKDIQFAKGVYQGPRNVQHKTYQPRLKGDPDKIKAAIELMRHA